jgi:hypothetical protein
MHLVWLKNKNKFLLTLQEAAHIQLTLEPTFIPWVSHPIVRAHNHFQSVPTSSTQLSFTALYY